MAQVAMAVSSQATRPRVGSVLSLIGVRRLPVSRGAVSFVSAAPDFVTWGKLPQLKYSPHVIFLFRVLATSSERFSKRDA